MSEGLDLMLRHLRITLKGLCEFRETLEPLAAERTAKKATRDDLVELERILRSFESNLITHESKWFEVMSEDLKFHSYLSHIGGNRVFEAAPYTVYENSFPYVERFLSKEGVFMGENYQDVYKILRAIERRGSNKASALIQRHIREFVPTMEESKKQQYGSGGLP